MSANINAIICIEMYTKTSIVQTCRSYMENVSLHKNQIISPLMKFCSVAVTAALQKFLFLLPSKQELLAHPLNSGNQYNHALLGEID